MNLATHVEDVAGVLRYEDLRDVVLVGHSYAGLVITGVAAHESERIARLVYYDAFVPDGGQSALDLPPPHTARAEQRGWADRYCQTHG